MVAHSSNSNNSNDDDGSRTAKSRLFPDGEAQSSGADENRGGADYADIERRASELAARLVGGMSFAAKQPGADRQSQPGQTRRQNQNQNQNQGFNRGWNADNNAAGAPSEPSQMDDETPFAPAEPQIEASIHEDDLAMDDLDHVLGGQRADVGQWRQDEREEMRLSEHGAPEAETDADADTGGVIAADGQPDLPDLDVAILDVSQFISRRVANAEDAEARSEEIKAEPESSKPNNADAEYAGLADDEDINQGMQRIAARMGESLQGEDEAGQQDNENQAAPMQVAREQEDLREIERQINALTSVMSEADDASPSEALSDEAMPDEALSGEAMAQAVPEASLSSSSQFEAELDDASEAGDSVRRLLMDLPEDSVANRQRETSTQSEEAALALVGKSLAALSNDAPAAPSPAYEARLEALERQVAQMADDFSKSKQRVDDALFEMGAYDGENGVLADSPMTNMRAQVEKLERGHVEQEEHAADSLDALHDALKDLAERLSIVEQAGGASSQAGGIASSVMTARMTENAGNMLEATADAGLQANEESASVAAKSVANGAGDDALPIRLDDGASSPEAMGEQTLTTFERQADVFQSDSADAANANANEAAGGTMAQSSHQGAVMRENAPEEHSAEWKRTYEPASASSSSAPDNQPSDNKQTDFLHHARAMAQASNERLASEQQEAKHGHSEHQAKTARLSAFLKATSDKDRQIEQLAAPGEKQKSTRKSLFGRDFERPNMLFVFTTLILLGTSAMLLYGMVRNNGKVDGTSKLNAVEKQPSIDEERLGPYSPGNVHEGEKAASGHIGSGKVKPVKIRPVKIRPATARPAKAKGEKHSALYGEKAKQAAGEKTDYAAMVSARIAAASPIPSPVEFTGSIPTAGKASGKNGSSGSMFTGNQGFVGPSHNKNGGDSLAPLPLSIGPVSLRTKANNGDAGAQYEVGRHYQEGVGVSKNNARMLAWYRRSANAGYAPALYRMATLYERGVGVKKDAKEALRLYLAAADKGNVKAMHNLGVIYTSGKLGQPDYKKALRWYEKAAEHGVKDSEFNTAIIYQNGLGVKIDEAKAYKWYFLAAKNGDREAGDILVEMRNNLPVKTRQKLRRQLQKWKPATAKREANAAKSFSRSYGQAQTPGTAKR